MDAVSNVGVWMDKIYMGDKSQGGGGRGGWYHSGGSQMGMGSMILCILACIFVCVCLSVLCNVVYSLAAWLPVTSCVSTNGSRREDGAPAPG